jgi:transglutaminase-like putative cysteine protease
VVTRAEPAALTARYLLPYRDTDLAQWLRAEPLIQVNDPRIGAQLRQIVGRERNAAKVAARILNWVAALPHARTAGVPNAARTLQSRSGDCNELTVLYVALARAAGLPARPVSGLLWRRGNFYYHAWAEVYLGRWVAVDPLLAQFPADAGRVRMLEGALARAVDLTRAIGNLSLETL